MFLDRSTLIVSISTFSHVIIRETLVSRSARILAFHSCFMKTLDETTVPAALRLAKNHFCVTRVKAFEIFWKGSGQLKSIRTIFSDRGVEWAGRPFSEVRVIGMNQREKMLISNRTPRFAIRAYSGR